MTLVVYCNDAPGGACTITKKYPWSSCGTKLVGTRSIDEISGRQSHQKNHDHRGPPVRQADAANA